VFAGGGTGGHLFPALAVAAELRRRSPGLPIVFIGGQRGIETRIVPQHGYPLRTMPLAGLKGASVTGSMRAAVAAAAGVARAAAWFLRDRPALVIGVGGYASGPSVLAARLLGVPTMILEQNHFPGATNRWLARWVDAVCVPSEVARRRLGNRGTITGNPVAAEFAAIGAPPNAEPLSVLVFGGSRGARSINRAMAAALPALARLARPPRIVHQTGADDFEATQAAYHSSYSGEFEVQAFFDDMPRRLGNADLVFCRAGATTLSELAVAGRPAILIPYPHAADDHQTRNAQALEEAGAAVVVRDGDFTAERIAALIQEFASDAPRRHRMAEAARGLARPDAAAQIADVAETLRKGGRRVS